MLHSSSSSIPFLKTNYFPS